jgi:hypothetical protein
MNGSSPFVLPPSPFPDALRKFIDGSPWKFARTMPEWPHEYLKREDVDQNLFDEVVRHIHTRGFEGIFYSRSLRCFTEDGLLYWTRAKRTVEKTLVIDRCWEEESYEYRSRNGTLPPVQKGISTKQRWH